MNRMEMIRAMARKSAPIVAPKPKGLHCLATGEPSAVKPRQRCEYKRGGNFWHGNFGASCKTPQEVAAGLPTEAAVKPQPRTKHRHTPHALNVIAERLKRDWQG